MKNILQITISTSKKKVPQSKIGKWLYWSVWFKIWYIWRKRLSAAFYGALADFLYWMVPKHIKDEIDQEFANTKIKIDFKDE